MQPGAQIQATIEILDLWYKKLQDQPMPADGVLDSYFRSRRYIGSKDRRNIAEHFYYALRGWGSLRWIIEQAGVKPSPRLVGLVSYIQQHRIKIADMAEMCDAAAYGPAALEPWEHTVLKHPLIQTIMEAAEVPLAARHSLPVWLESSLIELWGEERLVAEMAALNQPAKVDLRVNTLKSSREEVLRQLQVEGLDVEPTPLSPDGIRLSKRIPIASHPLYQQGVIEVQDEASQLAARLVQPQTSHSVMDLCAGAGGKTLAIAARMNNKGRLVACDIIEWRLQRSKERLKRAGVQNTECRALNTLSDKWLKRQAERFDRVLLDVPCTGSGTWRRNPDLKWRMQQENLDSILLEQAEILNTGARLVKPGGRVIYSTCSLLKEENEAQIEAFLSRYQDFEVVPIAHVWAKVGLEYINWGSDYMRLTPAQHGTDGFFVAVLQRKAPPVIKVRKSEESVATTKDAVEQEVEVEETQ